MFSSINKSDDYFFDRILINASASALSFEVLRANLFLINSFI